MTSLATALASSGTGQNMGAGAMAIMSVGIMVCLAALLIPIYVANRHPASPRHRDRLTESFPVQGGMHRGDGRSVAPRRDAPASANAGPERQGAPTRPTRSANQ